MKNTEKIEVITIKGMAEKFGVSVMTIYRSYLPTLSPVVVQGRMQYFSFKDAQKIHTERKSKLKNFKIIA